MSPRRYDQPTTTFDQHVLDLIAVLGAATYTAGVALRWGPNSRRAGGHGARSLDLLLGALDDAGAKAAALRTYVERARL